MLQPRVRLELGQKIVSTQQCEGSHKEVTVPHILFIKIPSHTVFAHSQWPQDKLPVLSATPPGNWLPLLPRSAPLSRPSTLPPALLPVLLSPPSSSRPVASRPSTSLAPRRPSTVGIEPLSQLQLDLTRVIERADWPKEKLLVSLPRLNGINLVSMASRADNHAGVLQERHPRPHRLRLAGSRPGSQPP